MPVHSAAAYSGFGYYGDSFRDDSWYKRGSYFGYHDSNFRRGAFYGRYENGNVGSHMYVRNKLDYQVWKNPELLTPTHYTNNQRYVRGLNTGYFRLYHSGGITGRIRS